MPACAQRVSIHLVFRMCSWGGDSPSGVGTIFLNKLVVGTLLWEEETGSYDVAVWAAATTVSTTVIEGAHSLSVALC